MGWLAEGRPARPVGRIAGVGTVRRLHRALLVVAALAAGGWQTLDRAPTESVTIDLVAVDPAGRVVENLGPADFIVTEGGTPQSVQAVRLVTLPAAGAPAASASPSTTSSEEALASDAGRDASRQVAIYLDEYHVTAGEHADRVQRELLGFVRAALDPDDLLVVLKPLDPLVSIRLTRDRASALRAIETFDPRRGDYAARSAFEEEFIAARPERIEAARSQIAVSAVHALATHLGTLGSGRKTLLLVTEGLGAGPRRRGDEPLPTIQTVVRTANRARVSIYPIDPSLASGSPFANLPPADERIVERRAADRQLLDAVAKDTGGALITNLGEGLSRALADSSAYYLLTFTSPALRRDGRFHAVTVRAANPRLTVRARSGYVARAPVELAERAGVRRESALPALTLRASRLIRPWFGTARGSDGRTRVTFVWEPAPRVPGERGRDVPSQVSLSVFDEGGVRLFERAVRPVGASLFGATDDARAVFESAPGRLRVEMSIQDAAMRRLDSDVRELTVGRFPGPVALGTAQVFRARSAREVRAITDEADPVPVASRQFSRADRLILRVPVYVSAGAPAPSLSARLVSGFGSTMRELKVDRAPAIDTHQVDVSLAGLAPGDYAVDLRAQHPDGTARDTVTFRVTP
jgi:VWFA-related protein